MRVSVLHPSAVGAVLCRALHPHPELRQGICAHGYLVRVLLASPALCTVGGFCVLGSGAEKLKGLKISYFGFSDSFGICIMASESAGTGLSTNRAAVKQLWAGSEQDDLSVCIRGRRTTWVGLKEVLSLEAGIPRSQGWPSLQHPAQLISAHWLGRARSDRGTRWGSVILQHSQRAELLYTKYLHFLQLLRAWCSFCLFWLGQVWAFL